MIQWEELPKDGAYYKCSFSTYFAPELWHCPREATKAIPQGDFDRIKEELPNAISLSGRAICPLHQTMIERGFQ